MSAFLGNRRKKLRRPADIGVDIRRHGHWGGWRTLEQGARGLDFNRFGMAFLSRRRWRPGQSLRLTLHGSAMRLHNVAAWAVSIERTGQGYRLGVCFYEGVDALSCGPRTPFLRYLGGLEEQLPPA